MRAKEFLFELADNPYRYIQTGKTNTRVDYEFTTDAGKTYDVCIKLNESHDLEIHFALVSGDRVLSYVTGAGDAMRVISTVIQITKQAVDQLEPNSITIIANEDEPSRVKLYRTMAQRAPQVLTGYQYTGQSYMEWGEHSYAVFILQKKKEETLESQGIPSPGTYEQEYNMFKTRGPRRIMSMTEEPDNAITLNQLYKNNLPHRDDLIWEFTGSGDWTIPLRIQTISPSELSAILQGQYNTTIKKLVKLVSVEQKIH